VTLAAVSAGRLLLETDATTADRAAGDGEPEEPADPPGTFRFSAWEKSLVEHRPTRLLVQVGAKGYSTLVLELDPGAPGLEDLGICLGPSETATGGIEGEVVFDDGARFEGPVHLHLRSAGADGVEERDFQDGEALYASEGIFVAEGIRPGDWLARPAIPGGIDLGWELARVVRVTPGARTRIRWTLPRGGDLCVEAKDERGRPVAEFALRIEHASRSIEARGAGGRALLRNVPPGSYRVAPEGSPATPVPDVVVVERGERSTLVVRFPSERGD
jgi:hypothetical protein